MSKGSKQGALCCFGFELSQVDRVDSGNLDFSHL